MLKVKGTEDLTWSLVLLPCLSWDQANVHTHTHTHTHACTHINLAEDSVYWKQSFKELVYCPSSLTY